MMPDTAPKPKFKLIQALRGVAALWVVLFHIDKGKYVTGMTDKLPEKIYFLLFSYGSAGVAIFFVLSGFVISHSLAEKAFTGRDFANFVVRRSIRLDPPYWAAIVFSLAVAAALARVNHEPVVAPSLSTLLAHFFYTQEFVRAPVINIVFWTLTYEIQFYLLLAFAAWLRTRLVSKYGAREFARAAVMAPMAALALLAAGNLMNWAPKGLFVTLWHGFFLGVLAYEAGHLRRSPVLLLLLAAVTLVGAFGTGAVFGVPAAFTALGLFAAGRSGYLTRGFGARGFQFLGTISYSLYLIHVPASRIGFGAWGHVAGRGFAQDCVGLVVVLASILAASFVFWWLCERPSHNLALTMVRRRDPKPHH